MYKNLPETNILLFLRLYCKSESNNNHKHCAVYIVHWFINSLKIQADPKQDKQGVPYFQLLFCLKFLV